MEPSSLSQALQTLIAHASGDNPPTEVQEAIAALRPMLKGVRSDPAQGFASLDAAEAHANEDDPDDVTGWITRAAQLEAFSVWGMHHRAGWRMPYLCETDLAPAIGALIAWHDRLLSIPGGYRP